MGKPRYFSIFELDPVCPPGADFSIMSVFRPSDAA
jgi:hypothetical protein